MAQSWQQRGWEYRTWIQTGRLRQSPGLCVEEWEGAWVAQLVLVLVVASPRRRLGVAELGYWRAKARKLTEF